MTAQFPDRTNQTDENLWLEDIYGEEQLTWVRAQNERTLEVFDSEALAASKASILEVYDSNDRIPMVSKHADWFYNFWQDAHHPRGIWRRTTLESYKTDAPEWELLLDVDALGKDEDKEWVWAGAELCYPDYTRALIELSPDGGDAGEIREFDLESTSFVADGFRVSYGKTQATWIDADTIFVGTDFGEDSLTTSGYAREVRRWHRGTSLDEAETLLTIDRTHMVLHASHDHTRGHERDLLIEMIDFFNYAYYILVDNQPVRLELPTDMQIQIHRDCLTVTPKSDWTVGDHTWPAGSLLAISFDAFMAGNRDFTAIFTPDEKTSLQSCRWTKNHILLNLIRDVTSRILVATPMAEGWSTQEIVATELQTTQVWAVDEDDSDDYWMLSSGFLQPATLSMGSVGGGAAEPIKSSPEMFDASGLSVEQHFAMSKDGTRIPYFQIGASDLVLDGNNPTVLYGYGGFEISHTPAYDAATARGFIEDGGVYVIANIRGGGEYGPTWHTSAMRENRHRAYEDFSAVAQHLIDRGVTSPPHLGCYGGSNGGLLVGNMLTHYPELFGAIVCAVPLLDMKRFVHLNAGASWIAEYGDPENPDDWAFIQTFSPYHNLREGVDYPAVLFYTATSDDRVGPVQARKMAARMQERGIGNVWFFENLQGGHAGSADNSERATMKAVTLEFLRLYLK